MTAMWSWSYSVFSWTETVFHKVNWNLAVRQATVINRLIECSIMEIHRLTGKLWIKVINRYSLFSNYPKGTSIRRAPVFGRHQFFGTLEHYRKAHGSLLSELINYNYTACCWFSYIQQYFNTSITVLTNQVWKLLIALFKVPNTGAFYGKYNKRLS